MSVEDSPRNLNSEDERPVIVAMSTDPALKELLEGFGPRIQLSFVEDWQELTGLVRQHDRIVVLLDADQADPLELVRQVAELNALPHPPVIIEAADNQRAKTSMDRVNSGLVHRILLKPASPGAARLIIESAVSRSRQERPALRPLSAPAPASGRGKLMVAGVGLVVVLGLIVGLVLRPDSGAVPEQATPELLVNQPPSAPQRPAAPAGQQDLRPAEETEPMSDSGVALAEPEVDAEFEAPAAVELADGAADLAAVEPSLVELAAIAAARAADADAAAAAAAAEAEAEAERLAPPREIDQLIARARAQVQAGVLIQPEADSAVSLYRRAAAIDRSDAGVVALRTSVAEAVLAAVPRALALGDIQTAEELLATAAELAANESALADQRAQLQSMIARQEAERQAQREAEMLNAGLQRMAAQQFLVPVDDSAAFHLARLRAENPNHPGLSEPLAELMPILTAAAADSMATGDLDLAANALEWLAQLGADDSAVEQLSSDLTSVRRQQDFLRVPAAPNELRILHSEPAVFPSAALRRSREGWVDVDLIVGRDGLPREVEVVDSDPGGVFERAALNAVRRYRFEPFEYGGNRYERRVELRVVFSAD
ncbi:MAG: energy transducer TonB [Wenzhouxiangella sp.]